MPSASTTASPAPTMSGAPRWAAKDWKQLSASGLDFNSSLLTAIVVLAIVLCILFFFLLLL
uniref:Uncharacterized protein n=1 Tax=Arundo donax TaxID=35708 RepID=A0A0A9ETN2_ARUDO